MITSLVAGLLLSNGLLISEQDIANYDRYLASPELEGRLTTMPGADKAAGYIQQQFKKAGLKVGPTKSYIHEFEISVNLRPTKNNHLQFVDEKGKKQNLKIAKDYLPLAGTVPNKPISGKLVYVGFGLEGENWNDYASVDVKGKVVLAFRGAPDGVENVSNANKARTAAAHGATGIIFVGPAAVGRAEFPHTNRAQGVPTDLEIGAAGIHSKFFKWLVGIDFAVARAKKSPESKELGISVDLLTELEKNVGIGKNVIGYLPGHDPILKNEFIIIGGHYDHLGYGEVGSRTGTDGYHGGADDNGSGTAAVMALANYFAKRNDNRRTIIFQCYSGEEEGLVGSTAWGKDNPDILAKTTAMLNMDMIGQVRQNNVYVFGLSSSDGWQNILDKVHVDELNLVTAPHVRGDSDQYAFAKRNVPVLFFHTGLTNEYHTEKDLMSTINLKGAAKVASAVAETALVLDTAAKLEFNPKAELGNRPTDRKVPPSDPVPPAQGGEQTARRIRVGFVPSMSDTGVGALLDGVTPDTPASKAGFRAGDRIIEFNGHAVKDLESLSEAMKTAKPGDKVKIRYLRDGKEQVVDVTVEERIDG